MGDAKRRKQLGLMPTLHPFEVEVDRDGKLSFIQQPVGEAEREQIALTLTRMLPVGAHWDQAYRTTYVMAGLPEALLNTREDVEAITVPPRRRLLGELAIWPGEPREEDADSVQVEGTVNTWLHFRLRQHASAHGPWSSLPVVDDFEQVLGYLMQHPVLNLTGELVGSSTAELTQGGELSWTVQPPEAQRAGLDELTREWSGKTPELWLEFHQDRLADNQHPDYAAAPSALRVTFELREPAPLQPLFAAPLEMLAGLDVFAGSEQFYSTDGETWLPYPLSESDEGGNFFDDSIDLETVEVTVWSDGRVEWAEDAFTGETFTDLQAEGLRASLRDFTGAGDSATWAEYSRVTLEELYSDELLALDAAIKLPVLSAVKMDVPAELPDDSGPDGATDLQMLFFENELSFDGETWRDVEEELPPELVRFAPRGSAARTIDMPTE
ncbi:hypothetical protein [Deinococcus sp.]|uniref:hypothetical protein n=1 Tax=Deinococcus sp. TaxID=47478 RepID=UPI0025FCF811|nr:hypothetical protein [Deinococcus sp.]